MNNQDCFVCKGERATSSSLESYINILFIPFAANYHNDEISSVTASKMIAGASLLTLDALQEKIMFCQDHIKWNEDAAARQMTSGLSQLLGLCNEQIIYPRLEAQTGNEENWLFNKKRLNKFIEDLYSNKSVVTVEENGLKLKMNNDVPIFEASLERKDYRLKLHDYEGFLKMITNMNLKRSCLDFYKNIQNSITVRRSKQAKQINAWKDIKELCKKKQPVNQDLIKRMMPIFFKENNKQPTIDEKLNGIKSATEELHHLTDNSTSDIKDKLEELTEQMNENNKLLKALLDRDRSTRPTSKRQGTRDSKTRSRSTSYGSNSD